MAWRRLRESCVNWRTRATRDQSRWNWSSRCSNRPAYSAAIGGQPGRIPNDITAVRRAVVESLHENHASLNFDLRICRYTGRVRAGWLDISIQREGLHRLEN